MRIRWTISAGLHGAVIALVGQPALPMPLAPPAWTFGVHDPPAAWLIVFAYLIAAGCCLRAWRREVAELSRAASEAGRRRRDYAPGFWLLVAGALVLLAINKPLDLHNILTEYGRRLAIAGGWYEQRRRAQLAFAVVLGVASLAALLLIGWRLRGALGRYAVSLAGLWLLALFAALRIVSFHHVDAWFGTRVRALKLHWIVELLAIALIAVGTMTRIGPGRPPPSSAPR